MNGGLVLGLAGCVVDVGSDRPPRPCDRVACSIDGYCEAGECFCEPGFVGDPYALHGCQPLGPNSPCQTTCGLNAYCDAGSCVCADGFVSVCGDANCVAEDRMCDGESDCANGNDESPEVCERAVVQLWSVVDGCDDGRDVQWQLWALDRQWAWPAEDTTFSTAGYDRVATQSIECVEGERVCFGAFEGERQWGVGRAGTAQCDDCCFVCAANDVEVGALTCG